LGAWPFSERIDEGFIGRIKAYAVKSVREAKVHTAWLQADEDYENAYLSFITKVLEREQDNIFLKDLRGFQRKVARFGIFNGLSQTILKMTSPGVPDFYQGAELWDLNLVDPDNRRPIDFEKRMAWLRDIRSRAGSDTSQLVEELMATKEDGRVKLFLIYKALQVRRELSALFRQGHYIPLKTSGKFRNHIITFARRRDDEWAVVVASRFLTGLLREEESWPSEGIWQDTFLVLPDNAPLVWTDRITDRVIDGDGVISIGKILTHLPVSLLVGYASGTR
jgi:(1->4)-alpha-D-glucan 1-alpha-D-glucosylmutase